jgi:subtilisin family serine protease
VKDYRTFSIGFLVFVLTALALNAAEYRRDEVIIKFKAKGPQALSSESFSLERPFIMAVDDAQSAIREFGASDEVEYVEPNYVIEAEDVPEDWPYKGLWSELGLESAWDLIAQQGLGRKVVVAVVDSGVDLSHPDLQGRIMAGYDYANKDSTPEDDSGHGTKVCGILGAIGNNATGIAGVDWDVDLAIMPVKFMKVNNGKTTGDLSDAIDAIYYAVDNGAEIINASWGFYEKSNALNDAIAYARSKGVLFVASAGNSGQDNDKKDHYPSNCSYDNVIAVAALDSDGSIAAFSNYGSRTVHIAAPGVGISTTTINSGYISYASGTSFATPFVTGVAAMVLSQSAELDCATLREIILETASKSPSAGSSMIASGGCVNAYEALMAEGSLGSLADASSGSSQTDTTDTTSAVSSGSGGGGGGGGCFIETAHGVSMPTAVFLLMIMIVLFPALRRKDQE